MVNIFLILLMTGAGNFEFQPPPGGIGDEFFPVYARSLGMGYTGAGVADSTTFFQMNPAASAWIKKAGISFNIFREYGDISEALEEKTTFPLFSAAFPLPGGIVLSGSVSGRSSILESSYVDSTDAFPPWTAEYDWSGGVNEAYIGISVKTAPWLAFSLGSINTYGDIRSDVNVHMPGLQPDEEDTLIWVDESRLKTASGVVFGFHANTSFFSLGGSITTDRSSEIETQRMFTEGERETLHNRVYIPGEGLIGISIRPHRSFIVAADYHFRKSLTLLERETDEGSIFGLGTEVVLNEYLKLRCGYSAMDGLWRDGSRTYTIGGGYTFSAGKARIDIAYGYEDWNNLHEHKVMTTFWIGDNWLGQ